MSKPDPRWVPYQRKDGWGAVSRVRPDPDSPTGWLCPGCGANATVFYGQGPLFENGRYRGPDERLCLACFNARW